MAENMFFLDSECEGNELNAPPPPPKKIVCLFMLYAWLLKIILLDDAFFLRLLLGMYPKSTYKISCNSKDFV